MTRVFILGFVLPLYTVCQNRRVKLWLKNKKELEKRKTVKP